MRKFIRLGDRTSHGGIVMTASKLFYIGDKAVARKGDICTCPIKGHGNCIIMEGDPDFLIDDIPAALEGHKLSCGAALYSSMPNAGRVYEAGDSFWSGDGKLFEVNGSAAMVSEASTVIARFDEQVQFTNVQGLPYADVRYLLHLADGETTQGHTDAQGRTARITTDEPTVISRAELYYTAGTCCARHAKESAQSEPSQIVELQGVTTNPQDVGSSVAQVTPPAYVRRNRNV